MDTSREIEELENRNKDVLETLYKALARGDTGTVATLLASDLEWWFHGPPHSQHMMRVLTGKSDVHMSEFEFEPRSITAIDADRVVVEGWEGAQAYWVHVWTVKDGQVVTQLREYFNTWLTVRDLRVSGREMRHHEITNNSSNNTLWQSEPREHLARSLPGLVLAI